MVTYIEKRIYKMVSGNTLKYICEISCLSTDTKPTANIVTGSVALEVDTGDIYLYDEASTTWNKMCSIKEQ